MIGNPLVIELAASIDGLKRWELVRRDDGFFLYSEDSYFTEDLRESGGPLLEYWSPTHFSGFFATAEEAKHDALGTLPWLKEIEWTR